MTIAAAMKNAAATKAAAAKKIVAAKTTAAKLSPLAAAKLLLKLKKPILKLNQSRTKIRVFYTRIFIVNYTFSLLIAFSAARLLLSVSILAPNTTYRL